MTFRPYTLSSLLVSFLIDASLDDTASTLSDQTSEGSIRVFLGTQSSSIPPGWRKETAKVTSTPHRKLVNEEDSTGSASFDMPSPACSPVAPQQENSHDFPSCDTDPSASSPLKPASSLHNTFLVELRNQGVKGAVLDVFVRASSPASQPSPSPKAPLLSRVDHLSIPASPAAHAVANSARLLLVDTNKSSASLSESVKPARREERPHLLPMCSVRSPTQSNIRVLRLTNLPWSITCHGLIQWLDNGIDKALMPLQTQIVSVHILCDRYSFLRLS